MSKILISGLVNTETTTRVRKFPIDYYPIAAPFFAAAKIRVSGASRGFITERELEEMLSWN